MIGMETKLKVTEYCKDRKSGMFFAHQSGMSHSAIAIILKNKNKEQESVERSASSKATTLTKL